jgi:glutaminyl-tRNA synthetase
MSDTTDAASKGKKGNFLTDIVEADLAKGRAQGRVGQVVTRFPPEPNGFLHIGHSKSILLNSGLARQFRGTFHLRFDDTNPTTEDTLYVDSIQADVRWLGGEWGTHLYFASDYFPRMYELAERLVREGLAYVDSQSVEAIREGRGSFEKPGVDSPFRTRSVEENLALLGRMRAGEMKDGEAVLRARIDMSHPNVLMRDPLLYRIRHAHHHRTGDAWCIYPMYDFAHPLEDAFEGITHSICTLEFESNRELYDWVLDHTGPWDPRPRQYEFARLALGYTVMSKRKLLQLVQEKRVSGWDDPRMPTVAGMRRRGVTPEALRDFADRIGVAKNNSLVDIGKLEFSIRNDLEQRAPRALAVLDPLPVTVTNWPAGKTETLSLPWWPTEPGRGGSREVPFSGELFLEREDFALEPPAGWKRLAPGGEVRLMGAYVIRCDEVLRGSDGAVTGLRCTYDAASAGGEAPGGRKVAGTLHWVDARASVAAPVRLYDRLFTVEQPDADGDFLQHLNPASLREMANAHIEPALAKAEAGSHYQFVRQGYFFVDPVESKPGAPVFNRTIGLKDTWAKPAEAASERRDKKAAAPREDAEEARRARTSAREKMLAENPEMAARSARFTGLRLGADEADTLCRDADLAAYFEATVAAAPAHAKPIAKWLLNEVAGRVKDASWSALPLAPAGLAQIVEAVEGGAITTSAAKALLAKLVADGGDVAGELKTLAAEKAQGAGGLEAAIGRVLEKMAAEVGRYRAGETKLFAVLLGAVMRETKGSADAAAVKAALTKAL